jgi:hypothetical protein
LSVGTRRGSGNPHRSLIAQDIQAVVDDLNAPDKDKDLAVDSSEVDLDMANMMDFMLALD